MQTLGFHTLLNTAGRAVMVALPAYQWVWYPVQTKGSAAPQWRVRCGSAIDVGPFATPQQAALWVMQYLHGILTAQMAMDRRDKFARDMMGMEAYHDGPQADSTDPGPTPSTPRTEG